MKMESENEQIACIRFNQICGNLRLNDQYLQLDLINLEKGTVYGIKISDEQIAKEKKRYKFFSTTKKLFAEIKKNRKLHISDQGYLIFEITATYQMAQQNIQIEIPLNKIFFQSQSQKVAKISEYYLKVLQENINYQANYRQMKNLEEKYVQGLKEIRLLKKQREESLTKQKQMKQKIQRYQKEGLKMLKNAIKQKEKIKSLQRKLLISNKEKERLHRLIVRKDSFRLNFEQNLLETQRESQKQKQRHKNYQLKNKNFEQQHINPYRLSRDGQNEIKFKPEINNLFTKNYKLTNHGKNIKYKRNGQWFGCSPSQSLPKQGVHYYRLTIVKTHDQAITLGVCAKQVKDIKDSYNEPLSLSLDLWDGSTYPGGIEACGKIHFMVGQSVFKVCIDMDSGSVEWLQDEKSLWKAEMSKELRQSELYPIVTLCHLGDQICFLYE